MLLGRGEGAHHDEPTPLVVALAVKLDQLDLVTRYRAIRYVLSAWVHGFLLF